MKLVVDMNLSPSWIERLEQHGFDAVHWSTIGAPSADDNEMLSWARTNGLVVLTHDLDFSAILAATSELAPSVVQLSMQDLLSDRALLHDADEQDDADERNHVQLGVAEQSISASRAPTPAEGSVERIVSGWM